MTAIVSRPARGLAALVCVAAAGTTGSLATLPNIPTWYRTLAKPWFTPPDGVFGPAWTLLYLLMAAGFYRALGRTRPGRERSLVIGVFLVHMALNALWSVAFFGNRSPALGLVDVALLWTAAVANVAVFWRVERIAGALMIPNALWVSFAALLNIAIWRMN